LLSSLDVFGIMSQFNYQVFQRLDSGVFGLWGGLFQLRLGWNVVQWILQVMGSYGFSCKGGVNHFSSLFVKFNLVNGMNIPCQYLKIDLLEIRWCPWLLYKWLYEGHLHLSFLDVKSWHQPSLIGGCKFEMLCIGLCLQFIISHFDFLELVLNVPIPISRFVKWGYFYTELPF